MSNRLHVFCVCMDVLIQTIRNPDTFVHTLVQAAQIEREREVHAMQIRVHNYMENERRQFRNQKLLDAIKECGDKPWPTERNSE